MHWNNIITSISQHIHQPPKTEKIVREVSHVGWVELNLLAKTCRLYNDATRTISESIARRVRMKISDPKFQSHAKNWKPIGIMYNYKRGIQKVTQPSVPREADGKWESQSPQKQNHVSMSTFIGLFDNGTALITTNTNFGELQQQVNMARKSRQIIHRRLRRAPFQHR